MIVCEGCLLEGSNSASTADECSKHTNTVDAEFEDRGWHHHIHANPFRLCVLVELQIVLSSCILRL